MRGVAKTPLNNFSTINDLAKQITEIKNVLLDLPVYFGSGSPENQVHAKVGSMYLRSDGGTSTTLYVKESGDITKTGWVAK